MIYESDCWNKSIHNQISQFTSKMLWRFIQNNAKENEAEETVIKLTGLSKKDIRLLTDIRLLLSKDIKHLIENIAPKIINRLSKDSINIIVRDRNQVRGKIDWQKTISVRAVAGNDISLFVYTKMSQIYDLPENRLFLFLIKQVFDKARLFAGDLLSNLTWYAEEGTDDRWIKKVAIIASQTSRILRNPFVSKIGIMYEINDRIIEATKHSRHSHYRELAEIAERFIFSQKKPIEFLKKELDGNILEPLNKDTLYEIAVLFKTILASIELGWTEKSIGLIGGSNPTASILTNGDIELRIFFQKLPRAMSENSQYGKIMLEYGLSEKLRRPDIILELTRGLEKKFIIIEVKRSQRRSYLVDGTYKLLGYLKDFSGVIKEHTSISGVLVGWDGILHHTCKDNEEVYLLNWHNYEEGIKQVLAGIMQQFEVKQEN